jgi:hypothetical protein
VGRAKLISSWQVEFKTGYDLTDNEIHRITERMAEVVKKLADEYFANMTVTSVMVLPGPKTYYDLMWPGKEA